MVPAVKLEGLVRSASLVPASPLLSDHSSAFMRPKSAAELEALVVDMTTPMLSSVYPPVLLPVVNAWALTPKRDDRLLGSSVCPVLLTSTAAEAGAGANRPSAPSSSARTGKSRERRRKRPVRASGRREPVDVEGANLRFPPPQGRCHIMADIKATNTPECGSVRTKSRTRATSL